MELVGTLTAIMLFEKFDRRESLDQAAHSKVWGIRVLSAIGLRIVSIPLRHSWFDPPFEFQKLCLDQFVGNP